MAAIKKVGKRNGYGEKVSVKIVTVDKAKRRVECAMRDGAMIYAAIWETGTIFRWPEVGETWTVRQDTGVWRLDKQVQTELGENESSSTPKTLEELPEGDTRIIGDTVHTASVSSSNITSSGRISALNQSLISHARLTTTGSLESSGSNSTEIWGESATAKTIDGVTPSKGDRLLVAKEGKASHNGIYEVEEFNVRTGGFNTGTVQFNFESLPVFNTLTNAVSFTTLPWLSKAGSFGLSGWSPPSFSELGGDYYNVSSFTPSTVGLGVQLTCASNSFSGAGRHFAVWASIPSPPSAKTGYLLDMLMTSSTTYTATLTYFNGGTEVESSSTELTLSAPFTFGIAVTPTVIRGYVNYAQTLTLGNTSLASSVSYIGFEGTGSNPLLTEFRGGTFPSEAGTTPHTTWRLKRASDEIRAGLKVNVSEGTTYRDTEWLVYTNDPIIVGETGVEFINSLSRLPVVNGEWHPASYLNGWASYNLGFSPAEYRKAADGKVHLRGLVKHEATGAAGTVIFNLPVGYRPMYQEILLGHDNNQAASRFDITTSGNVTYNGPGSTVSYCSLSGMSFYTD